MSKTKPRTHGGARFPLEQKRQTILAGGGKANDKVLTKAEGEFLDFVSGGVLFFFASLVRVTSLFSGRFSAFCHSRVQYVLVLQRGYLSSPMMLRIIARVCDMDVEDGNSMSL